ncbi:phosphate/phosphite/phosphonate ABC transporter substrate-binding protein [Dictyobacter halimunensis]|uniref:phosphate/phosphite/phosphonate ABC transporter substrate-binding protein n=1 Tax=Dictyobacter halimunensis TaxID=3026934 RepID=UPI0030C69A7B
MTSRNEREKLRQLVLATEPGAALNVNQPEQAVARLERYFSETSGLTVRVILSENYEEILAGMEAGTIDVARLGPYAFALAQARFGARALVNSVDITTAEHMPSIPYRSLIFTRADSGITHLMQLKGRTFGFVDPRSASGYLVATFLLQQAGLDPKTDLKEQFLFSHQAVADAVSKGEVAAGAVAEEEFIHYQKEKGLPAIRLLATSPLLSRGPLAMRPDLPAQLERKLLIALENMHQADVLEGSKLIKMEEQRFVAAVQREHTLKRIAELAGVSYATVSRAINGKDRIAPATTARILQLVDELGYRPNANARSLHKPTGDLIGLMLPSLAYPALDDIIAGIQATLAQVQMQLLICPIGSGREGDATRQKAYFEMLTNSRFEGMLLTQWSALDPKAMDLLARSRRPYALLEQDLLGAGLHFASNWLQQQGHRQLMLVTGARSLLEPTLTTQMWSQLTAENIQHLHLQDPANDETGWSELLQQGKNAAPAFLCTDNETALSVRAFLKQQRLDWPVIGIGAMPATCKADLTTLTFDGFVMGKIVTRRLLKMLNIFIPGESCDLNFNVSTTKPR